MSHSQLPIYLQYVQALGPTLVAAAVGVVAYRQWATAREKLRLDLFEKRFEIYSAYHNFLITIFQTGKVSSANWDELNSKCVGEKFLFKEKLLRNLDEIRKFAANYEVGIYKRDSQTNQTSDEEHKKIVEELSIAQSGLKDKERLLTQMFTEYLSFQNVLK
jgi:hypothetical protein